MYCYMHLHSVSLHVRATIEIDMYLILMEYDFFIDIHMSFEYQFYKKYLDITIEQYRNLIFCVYVS